MAYILQVFAFVCYAEEHVEVSRNVIEFATAFSRTLALLAESNPSKEFPNIQFVVCLLPRSPNF